LNLFELGPLLLTSGLGRVFIEHLSCMNRMFAESCKKGLNNTESLLSDAKKLMNVQSFGVAQSLSVIAYEEVGKAVILGLADLDRVPKSVAALAMEKHPP